MLKLSQLPWSCLFTWLQFLPSHAAESKNQSLKHWPHILASPHLVIFWISQLSILTQWLQMFFSASVPKLQNTALKTKQKKNHTFRPFPTEPAFPHLGNSLVDSPKGLLHVNLLHLQKMHGLIISFISFRTKKSRRYYCQFLHFNYIKQDLEYKELFTNTKLIYLKPLTHPKCQCIYCILIHLQCLRRFTATLNTIPSRPFTSYMHLDKSSILCASVFCTCKTEITVNSSDLLDCDQ